MKVILRMAYLVAATGLASLAFAAANHEHQEMSYAAGEPGDPGKPARSVTMTMQENADGSMNYTPDALDVKEGEQIRFELINAGKTEHEFVLNSKVHNAQHKLDMEDMPEMHHDDQNAKRLDAGASAEILWHFSKPGTYEFACLIPGHYEVGMHGTVTVR